MTTRPGPLRTLIRLAFALYTAALLTATHWPGLTTPHVMFNRTDLIIHAGVFCIWTCLFYLSNLVGASCPSRRLMWAGVIGLCFGMFDEFTQPLPPFHRHFDWLDIVANSVGVLLGVGLIVAARRVWPRFRADLG